MVHFTHKIHIPLRPQHVISRPRLNGLLSNIADRRLICISAPSGYGKTSLLTDFAHEAQLPICWYTLDAIDQDMWIFLEYLVACIEHRFPASLEKTRALLNGYNRPAFATVVDRLTSEIYHIPHAFALVLDDWHLVDAVAEISSAMGQILQRCTNCKIILASRSHPHLPNVMLLAVRRQMLGIDEQQLRFTDEEASAVLTAEHHVPISLARIQSMVSYTDGWIAGILLLFSTQGQGAPCPVPSDDQARRQIYRFLAEQVFDHQRPAIQLFLLRSSLLEDLSLADYDAIFPHGDSCALLESILRQRLFITELRDGVFRYHPLFREFLHEHYQILDPDQHRAAMLQIADFYTCRGQWIQAFEQYMAIRAYERAQHVVLVGGEQLYAMGRLETLETWFRTLPEEAQTVPLLCLKARVAMDRGATHEAQTLAQRCVLLQQPEDRPRVLLLHAQIARVLGHYHDILQLGKQILATTSDLELRGAALRIMGVCYQRQGKSHEAMAMLEQALQVEQERGDLGAIVKIQHELGIVYKTVGLFQQAERYFSLVDAYCLTVGNTGLRALSLNSKGIMQYLSGQYAESHATLSMALQEARSSAVPPYQAAVLSSLGDLYAHLQLWAKAQEMYHEARITGGTATITSDLDIAEVQSRIGQHRYEDASSALQELPEITRQSRASQILLLQAITACGRGDLDRACELEQRSRASLEPLGPSMDLALTYLLGAEIAVHKAPSSIKALIEPLERAAAVAEQLGHSAFLAAALLRTQGILRRATVFGWPRAMLWQQQQQQLLQAARAIGQGDQRNHLAICSLGAEQIQLDQQIIAIGWNKAREVLFFLLSHPVGATIDELCEAIWPELSGQRSREALRTAVYQLRSILPRTFIVLRGRQRFLLDRDIVRVEYDAEQFMNAVEGQGHRIERLIEAINLYHGHFLPSSTSDWSLFQRTHLEQAYLYALRTVAAHHEAEGMPAEALLLYQRLLATDRLDEAAHAGVMRCQIALGKRAAAVTQYHELRHILHDELGLDTIHTSEVEQIYRQLL